MQFRDTYDGNAQPKDTAYLHTLVDRLEDKHTAGGPPVPDNRTWVRQTRKQRPEFVLRNRMLVIFEEFAHIAAKTQHAYCRRMDVCQRQ